LAEVSAAGLSPDRPLSDPLTDRLGYAPFAQALANSIRQMEAPDGIVVALYGQWGLGKTTALNFIEHYLSEAQKGGAAPSVILRFNPWWFTGRIDLAVAYLTELQKTFRRWNLVTDKARRALSSLATLVSAVPVPGAGVAKGIGEVLDPGAPDVRELKQEIAGALAEQPRRLVVVIDDIDRLTPGEIRELFSVIKAVADFPNTVYLLAFDQRVVGAALSTDEVEGSAYVEKIVQVPFELPIPETSALEALFLEQLEAIVGEDVDPDLLNRDDLSLMLHFALMPLMDTPRDVVRLTNSLRVSYAAVRGEVNVVDFVGLEAARVFLPPLFESIRRNPEMFGAARGFAEAFRALQPADRAQFHQQWVNVDTIKEEEREAAKELAAFLFPETATPLDVAVRRSRTALQSRRNRHVTEPDFYPLYFRLSLGDAALSREQIQAMVEQAVDPAAFRNALLELANEATSEGRTKASIMLDELIGQASRFDAAALPDIIGVLVSIGDQLWIEGDEQILLAGNDVRLWLLLQELLSRIGKDERVPVLVRAIEESQAIAMPVRVVAALQHWYGVEEGSIRDVQVAANADEHALIDSAGIRRLEETAAERIARAAREGQLFLAPRISVVLARWADWASLDDVKSWVDEVRGGDDLLGQLLVAYMQTGTNRNGEAVYRLNPRWLERYVDPAGLVEDVRRLEPSAVGDTAVAVTQFLAELQMLEEGQDPDWPQR
jgi:predicted KAP-like P-loop ATPase